MTTTTNNTVQTETLPLTAMAYAYHKQTGEYAGTTEVESDPLEEGMYLIPSYATLEAPLEVEANQAVVFRDSDGNVPRHARDGSWQLIEDYRGSIYWLEDGSDITIATLGETVPDDALLEAPVIPPTSEEQTDSANRECTRRIHTKWSQVGQINAALGIYSEDECTDCSEWIALHRDALAALLAREDFLEIDVTEDQYWP